MPDFEFRFGRVSGSYAAKVQRAAVLYSLLGPVHNAHGIVVKTQRLVTIWRARQAALSAAGWDRRDARLTGQYMRNCPPPFALASPWSRPCKESAVCPFCFAREALEVWQVVDSAFPWQPVEDQDAEQPARTGPPPLDGHFTLVERHRRYYMPFTMDDRTPVDCANELMTAIVDGRRQGLRQLNALGAFHFTTVSPKEGKGWEVHVRTLLMTPEGTTLPSSWKGRITSVDRPNRQAIYRAVSRICKYPRDMMYGDAALAAASLNARHPPRGVPGRVLRLSAMFGVFRGRAAAFDNAAD